MSAHRGARDGECSPAIDGHCRVPCDEVVAAQSLAVRVSPCGSCPLLFLSIVCELGGLFIAFSVLSPFNSFLQGVSPLKIKTLFRARLVSKKFHLEIYD